MRGTEKALAISKEECFRALENASESASWGFSEWFWLKVLTFLS
jgi:hypothetical protein